MLDIERGPDVDPGVEQLLHVLPALGMARSGGIGVGVFVHQQQARLARQGAVDVELQQLVFAILDGRARQDVQPFQQGLGLLASVGLHDADNHVDALGAAALAGAQHLVGLAYARRHAEIDLQPPPPLPLGMRQKRVRIGADRLIDGHAGPRRRGPLTAFAIGLPQPWKRAKLISGPSRGPQGRKPECGLQWGAALDHHPLG